MVLFVLHKAMCTSITFCIETEIAGNAEQESRYIGHFSFLLRAVVKADKGVLKYILRLIGITENFATVGVDARRQATVQFLERSLAESTIAIISQPDEGKEFNVAVC